jgi:hypothetical protein
VSGANAFAELASARGLTSADGFQPGAVTPLLAVGGRLEHAYSGELIPGVPGVIAHLASALTFNVVFAALPESRPFVPRLVCERNGRSTDTTHYGFEVRTAKVWTESTKLNERFKVTTSPFQDPNGGRQTSVRIGARAGHGRRSVSGPGR